MAMLLLSGGCLQQSCPCGADPSDPLAAHDLAFRGSHFLDNECACRCGNGEWVAFPKDTDCQDIDAPCVDAEGRDSRFVCE